MIWKKTPVFAVEPAKKTVQVVIRVEQEELARFDAIAQSEGLTRSKAVRSLMRDVVGQNSQVQK